MKYCHCISTPFHEGPKFFMSMCEPMNYSISKHGNQQADYANAQA